MIQICKSDISIRKIGISYAGKYPMKIEKAVRTGEVWNNLPNVNSSTLKDCWHDTVISEIASGRTNVGCFENGKGV